MIAIRRTPCPATLEGKTAAGDHYNTREVVDALWDMQHGKCCYCELPVPRKGHLKAVEHFHPKSVFRGLRNEWRNLLLACAQCNGKKGSKFPTALSEVDREDKVLYCSPGEALIIDPSREDPEQHVDYDFTPLAHAKDFAIIVPRGGSERGRETIEAIGLRDSYYTRAQVDFYLNTLRPRSELLLRAYLSEDQQYLDTQRASFEALMTPQARFAGLARSYARYKKLDGPEFDLTIPGPR